MASSVSSLALHVDFIRPSLHSLPSLFCYPSSCPSHLLLLSCSLNCQRPGCFAFRRRPLWLLGCPRHCYLCCSPLHRCVAYWVHTTNSRREKTTGKKPFVGPDVAIPEKAPTGEWPTWCTEDAWSVYRVTWEGMFGPITAICFGPNVPIISLPVSANHSHWGLCSDQSQSCLFSTSHDSPSARPSRDMVFLWWSWECLKSCWVYWDLW